MGASCAVLGIQITELHAIAHGDHHLALGVIVIGGRKLIALVQIVSVGLLRGRACGCGKSSKAEKKYVLADFIRSPLQ